MAFPDNQRPNLKADPDGMPVHEDDTVPLSHYDETTGASSKDVRDQSTTGLSYPDNYPY